MNFAGNHALYLIDTNSIELAEGNAVLAVTGIRRLVISRKRIPFSSGKLFKAGVNLNRSEI